MKAKIENVMEELRKCGASLEEVYNSGVVEGFTKESFPQESQAPNQNHSRQSLMIFLMLYTTLYSQLHEV